MILPIYDESHFYKAYGIRAQPQLYSGPRFFDVGFLRLPKNSVYHHFTGAPPAFCPKENDAVFAGRKALPFVHFVTELRYIEDNPRHVPGDIKQKIAEFHSQNPRIKKLANTAALTDDQSDKLVVYSYIPLQYVYTYQHHMLSSFLEWSNRANTMIDEIIDATRICSRHHYIYEQMPAILPTLAQLQHATEKLDGVTVKPFNNDGHSFFLFELFRWFTKHRKDSMFNRIPIEKLHLVNVVYIEAGQFSVLNLGFLNSLLKTLTPEEEAKAFYRTKAKCAPDQLTKRILMYYALVNAMKNGAAVSARIDSDASSGKVKNDDEDHADSAEPPEHGSPVDDHSAPNTNVDTDPYYSGNGDEVIGDPPDHVDLETLSDEEVDAHYKAQDAVIDQYLREIENQHITTEEEDDTSIRELIALRNSKDADTRYNQHCKKLLDTGMLSPKQYQMAITRGSAFRKAVAPDGVTPLHEYIQIDPESRKLKPEKTKLREDPLVIDKSFFSDPLSAMNAQANKVELPRNYAAAVHGIQNAGFAVTNYKVTNHEAITGDSATISFDIYPLEGKPSSAKLHTYVIDDDGNYTANGVTYRLKMQRTELPIVKISPTVVSLNSYYGKVFIERARMNSQNYGLFLRNRLQALAMADDSPIKQCVRKQCFDRTVTAPYAYTAISNDFEMVETVHYHFDFDYHEAQKRYASRGGVYPPEGVKGIGKDHWVIGYMVGEPSCYLVTDTNGYVFSARNGQIVPIGSIEQLLDIDTSKAPVEYATVSVFAQEIPIIIPLLLQYGFTKTLKLIGGKFKKFKTGEKFPFSRELEYSLVFKDYTLVFSRQNRYQQMLVAGLRFFDTLLTNYTLSQFDSRGVYVNLLENAGITPRYIREMDLMHDMFVDPITRDILAEMKEPLAYDLLLLRACELITTDAHPRELDPEKMRIRGYERMAGFAYRILVDAIREQRGKLNRAASKVNVKPFKLMQMISEDPSKEISAGINPIHALKERELVTYSGTGGRDRQTMVKSTRVMQKGDVGLIGEASPDNGDVGTNVYMSSSPLLKDTFGRHTPYNPKKDSAVFSHIYTNSAMLSPFMSKDDPKRVNFICVQNSHVIPTKGYHAPIIRTGAEYAVAHKVPAIYAKIAQQDGVVKSVKESGIIVEYKDGSEEGYVIGRHYGIAQGNTIPHTILSPLKEGDKFKEGDYLVYNDAFFEPDIINPNRLCYKTSRYAHVVFVNCKETVEDSCMISQEFSGHLAADMTKIKNVTIDVTQEVVKMVNEGDEVEADSPMCYLMDRATMNITGYTEDSLKTLEAISRDQPKAGVKGTVERIEVRYNADNEAMSESVREIAKKYENAYKRRQKSANKKEYACKSDSGWRVEGEPLVDGKINIAFYITKKSGSYAGDKFVVGNPSKTVCAGVMPKPYYYDDGTPIDVYFGERGIGNRILNSTYLIFGIGALMEDMNKGLVAVYEGKK